MSHHHSDQGVQYTATAYTARLQAAGTQISMAEVGATWQNNTAERGLRHIGRLQQISMSLSGATTHEYLRLLSIKQTCRFQHKSFFQFLLSRVKDMDQFEKSKAIRRAVQLDSFNSLGQEDDSSDRYYLKYAV
jgi:hypothetical protein